VFVTLGRPDPGRLKNGNNVYDQFCKELERDLGLKGLNTYSLFGRYDVFLQAWCNQELSYRLYTYVATSDLVRASIFYECRLLSYTWAETARKPQFSDVDLHNIEHLIKQVQDGSETARGKAITKQFLLPRPDRPGQKNWIRFVTVVPLLSPYKEEEKDEHVAKHFWPQVRESLKEAHGQFDDIEELTLALVGQMADPRSVTGMAPLPHVSGVLVEGITSAQNLSRILSFGFALTRGDSQLRGGSETYIVAAAQENWIQADEVLCRDSAVDHLQLRKLTSLFRLNSEELIKLSAPRAAWVLSQLASHTQLVEYERQALSRSLLLSWLRAYLCRDNEQAFRTLAVLMRVEGALGDLAKGILAAKADGKDTQKSLAGLFDKELKAFEQVTNIVLVEKRDDGTKIARIGSMKTFTLADWLNILSRINLGRIQEIDKGMVETALGDSQALETLREMIPSPARKGWRNMFAHGELDAPLPHDDAIPQKTDQMQQVTDFLARLAWIMRHLENDRGHPPT
jgi:hypothetical protein